MNAYGGADVVLRAFFNSVVDDSERQFQAAAALRPGKKPLAPTLQKDGWAPDPRKISDPAGGLTPIPCPQSP
jgi:hypothetical protein